MDDDSTCPHHNHSATVTFESGAGPEDDRLNRRFRRNVGRAYRTAWEAETRSLRHEEKKQRDRGTGRHHVLHAKQRLNAECEYPWGKVLVVVFAAVLLLLSVCAILAWIGNVSALTRGHEDGWSGR